MGEKTETLGEFREAMVGSIEVESKLDAGPSEQIPNCHRLLIAPFVPCE